MGFSRHSGGGLVSARGRKAHGRWTEGGRKVVGGSQRRPGSALNSKTFPRCLRQPSSGFPEGSQKVLRRCLICRLARKCLTWTRFRRTPAKRLSCAVATSPTSTQVELELSVQFPNLEGLS